MRVLSSHQIRIGRGAPSSLRANAAPEIVTSEAGRRYFAVDGIKLFAIESDDVFEFQDERNNRRSHNRGTHLVICDPGDFASLAMRCSPDHNRAIEILRRLREDIGVGREGFDQLNLAIGLLVGSTIDET